MNRLLAALLGFAIVLVALLAFVVWGDHGQASFEWMGWRIDTTASALVAAAGVSGLVLALLLIGLVWLVGAPRRFADSRRLARVRSRRTAVCNGFLALAAGDAAEARRQSRRAEELTVKGAPADPMALLLAARSAEAAGDLDAAVLSYEALAAAPETALAGRKGLMETALRRNDRDAALAQADAAYALSGNAAWAWRALLEARVRAGDWDGAQALVESAERRRTLPADTLKQVKAALAAAREGHADPARLDHALDSAVVVREAEEPLTLGRR